MGSTFFKELKHHFGCAYGAAHFTRLRDLFANLRRFRVGAGYPCADRYRSARSDNRRIHYKNLCAFAANSVKQQAISPHKADAHGEPCASISYFRNSERCFLTIMLFYLSRDSKSAAFAGAQPRAHPSFGVRARLSTPQSGARKPTIGAKRQQWLWRKEPNLLRSRPVCSAAFGHNIFRKPRRAP